MAKEQPRMKRYVSRRFLNRGQHHSLAAICSNVDEGSYYDGELLISDCYKHIELSLDFRTASERKNSIHKLDTIINEVTKLRAHLQKEQKRLNLK